MSADNVIQGGVANIPPQNMEPGFVKQPNVQQLPNDLGGDPNQPVKAGAGAPVQGGDLNAAIAALTAALGNKPAATGEPAAVVEPAKGNLNEFDVSSIEDPIIKSMATVLQTVGKGIDLDRALGKAIDDGRVDLIDVAYLREKGGANAEQLIQISKGIVEAIEAKSLAITSEIHRLAGGETQWNASIAAFNSNAPQELRLVVAQMLDSRKEDLIKAGSKLIVEYGKNSGQLPQVNPLLNSGAAAPSQGQALSKTAFQEELRKLNPQARDYETRRGELFVRRTLGRNLGL